MRSVLLVAALSSLTVLGRGSLALEQPAASPRDVASTAAAHLQPLSPAAAGQSQAGAAPASPVTFSRDVAPIVYARCVTCHRPSGSAPFSLLSYDEVRSRAAQIADAVARRAMPPWPPEPGHGEFIGSRRLADTEIATITRWAEGGAAEGDPALMPARPSWSGRWQLGEPDLILQTGVYTLRATGDDMYRNFVLPIPGGETRYVKAWEFLPGNTRVVHHATMQFDTAGTSHQLDADDPEPGYEGLIAHSVASPDGCLPGLGPRAFAVCGAGRHGVAASSLWFQVVARTPGDREKLISYMQAHVFREEIVGHEKMLEADPHNTALHNGVALLHASVGNLERAAAHFGDALRDNPDSPAANYNVGMALLLQGRVDEAAGYFAQALSLDPGYAQGHDGLGQVRQRQGNTTGALQHFREAVRLAPGNADARRHLADLERELAGKTNDRREE
jgi:tetratricopeptide (TPR) repeat protein